ncbi:MAG: prepilin-type N-terminal cleavage/methylation domain-containing protein [Planctomycetota bacterium]|nr:MAG: prepilin-type N-terminal cleavage/methylation domain-containing protein [Planctomycetota bacterium]
MKTAGRNNRSGMTLIEVLLALGLFAMLGLFVAGILNSVMGLWQNGERRGHGDLVFSSTLQKLRTDLRALHNGARGRFEVDFWEAVPAGEAQQAWYLPRMRFLAHGGAALDQDPEARHAVEIVWMLVPEDPANSRLCRLMRLTQLENPSESFLSSDRLVERRAREGAGLVVLDGVAWAEFAALDSQGQWHEEWKIPPDPVRDLPAKVRLRLERVAGSARNRPPRLDEDLEAAGNRMRLRGQLPFKIPEFALVEKEWMRVSGTPPTLSIAERGLRDTSFEAHPARAPVLLPKSYAGEAWVVAEGRRWAP